jgi:hypothetical protein
LEQNGLKLVFGSPLIADPCFFYSQKSVRMIVLVSDNTLHRFTFEVQLPESVFCSFANFASLMRGSDAVVAPPAALCERWDRVLTSVKPTKVVRGVHDNSIVVATRSGVLMLCELASSSVDEVVLGQTDVAGMVTLQRDAAFTFVLSRDGLFSGYALAGRVRFVSLQLKGRGIGLRMFAREANVVLFVALVQSASGAAELHSLRAEFPGSSVELELVAVETVPSSAALVDMGEGPAGFVLLHADGSLSVKVGDEWKKASHVSHFVPSRPSDAVEWAQFCRALKSDPYISRYLLRVVHADLSSRGFVGQDSDEQDLADVLFSLPSHERDSVVAVFEECHRQTLLGSSLCRIGGAAELPTVVGPGGLSVLFPLPFLSKTLFVQTYYI